jgi:hypothetical protein
METITARVRGTIPRDHVKAPPGDSWRRLERRRRALPFGVSRPLASRRPRQQPGLSPGEDSPLALLPFYALRKIINPAPSAQALAAAPGAKRSRSGRPPGPGHGSTHSSSQTGESDLFQFGFLKLNIRAVKTGRSDLRWRKYRCIYHRNIFNASPPHLVGKLGKSMPRQRIRISYETNSTAILIH